MLFFRPLLVLIETNMEESVTYVTLDPQNTITSISQMNDDDKHLKTASAIQGPQQPHRHPN